MMAHGQKESRFKARLAGTLYVLSVLTAILAEATLHGRWLHTAGLFPVLCFTIVTLLLFAILRPISRTGALLAASFNLVGLALEVLEWHLRGVNMAMLLHGLYCLLIGYLVFRSAFLPRILGMFMAIGGLGWWISLWPSFAHALRPYGEAVGFFGEGSLMLWLLVMGINSAT